MTVDAVTPQATALAAALAREQWNVENVELVTVGIDIGSSTSHLMFSRVHLQREAQSLSSRFVVIERTALWRSPIILTPYLAEETIDADALEEFIAHSYREAGVAREDIDSGAVILTGEAIKRRNAAALAELVADESGKFVCASAGHHLESTMAAHGSGAVELSRELAEPLLHVDIGGGTSKLALLHGGEVIDTAAISVGGRLLAFEEGLVTRVEGPALTVAGLLGLELAVGQRVSAEQRRELAEALAGALVELISGGQRSELTNALLVTEPPTWAAVPQAISISGGVAEYIYGHERTRFGDIAPELADSIGRRMAEADLGAAVIEPPQGIRATVIGASQFSVQISGNTVDVSAAAELPMHGIPVLYPRIDLSGTIDPHLVAERVEDAARRLDVGEHHGDMAIAFVWAGDPSYARLRTLAEGVLDARRHLRRENDPLILLFEGDVARSVGRLLSDELSVTAPIVCLDGLELAEFDYVDVGAVIEPTGVVPVVIKSLLFAS